jgi:hypothetical protein
MEQSPSWEASRIPYQKMIRLLWEPKFFHRVHKRSPLVFILCQMNSIDTISCYFWKIHFNIILTSTPRSFKQTPSFKLRHPKSLRISLFPHTCHIAGPSHCPQISLFQTYSLFMGVGISTCSLVDLHFFYRLECSPNLIRPYVEYKP